MIPEGYFTPLRSVRLKGGAAYTLYIAKESRCIPYIVCREANGALARANDPGCHHGIQAAFEHEADAHAYIHVKVAREDREFEKQKRRWERHWNRKHGARI